MVNWTAASGPRVSMTSRDSARRSKTPGYLSKKANRGEALTARRRTDSRTGQDDLQHHCERIGPAPSTLLDKPGDPGSHQPRDNDKTIDEIHRLSPVVEEYLYSAMEDYRIDLVIDAGPNARYSESNSTFTLVCNDGSGLLTAPLRARFAQPAWYATPNPPTSLMKCWHPEHAHRARRGV